MRYVAAYALAVLGGHEHPTVADLERIITSVGGEFDAAHAGTLVTALAGKPIHEVIKAAESKLAAVPAGASAAAPAASNAPAKTQEKKVEKEEKKEEEEAEVALDLFGGGDEW